MFKLYRFAFIGIIVLSSLKITPCFAQALIPANFTAEQKINSINLVGNKTVSSEAILNCMSIKINSMATKQAIASDIKAIYATGYFQDVEIQQPLAGELVVKVNEKPTINDIQFEGFEVVTKASLKDKIISKKYNIVDEKKISQDLRTIEQAYVEKGYYLAKASYYFQEIQPGVVNIVFKVKENTAIVVRNVSIVGNEYFSDYELSTIMGTKAFSWASFFNSTGLFRDEYLRADQQNLTYFYRDNGFAEATVSAPNSLLNKNKTDIDVAYYIEQGEKYNVGKITISGDIITSIPEIKKALTLKEGELYRISKFNQDMKILKTYYGDHGFAFAYVYPRFRVDRKAKLYDVDYQITKGEKAYFRKIMIEGNVKTRDNVIRRAIKVSEGQLFNSTNLDKSKDNINRLGFFEGEVVPLESPDQANNAVDLLIHVKEKSTGSLQASLGASPNTSGGSGVTFFGSGQYQEKNFLGRAYGLGVNLQLSPTPNDSSKFNYTIGLNFSNPSLFDGPWSYSLGANYSKQVQSLTSVAGLSQSYLTTKSSTGSLTVGREIIENLRFYLGYSLSRYYLDPSVPLTAKFYKSGKSEEISQAITYEDTDNYLTPTSGIYLNLTNIVGLKIFTGEYNYGVVSANATYYLPVPFTETFKTNFRFSFSPQYAYQTRKDEALPYWKRLQLGNAYQMKGYSNSGETITPTIPVNISPLTGQTISLAYGGDKSLYGVAEYFIPIVPEAGLRFVTFAEAGEVLLDSQDLELNDIKYDVGFGFRWITPIAPFRFEWAFPVEHNQLGQAHFVFTIGYDSVGAGT
jgi:outer membrane protein insertion porin family